MRAQFVHPLLRGAAALLLLSQFGCRGPEGPQGPAGGIVSWEDAVAANKNAIYLLGIIPTEEDYVLQVGTGWAISPTEIITNAHVAYGIYDLCRDIDYNAVTDKIVAVKNETFTGQSGTYELISCSVHPAYNNFNPFSHDFALFTVNTTLESYITPATTAQLQAVKVGQSVGTLGFPGELTTSDRDGYQPIATFKDGTISALRPFDQRTTAVSDEANVVIQYNFNTTGGTSGSPVFSASNRTIAINNSGIAAVVADYLGNYVRISLGDLNFGIRTDQRSEVMSMPYQVNISDFRSDDPTQLSSLTSGQYRIDFDWNSSYDFDLWLCVGGSQFMTGWIDNSRAHIYPFCVHHGDDTYYGPELATILQLTKDVKIYAVNWDAPFTSFSTSSATCELSSSAGIIATVSNPPSGFQRFWIIGTLSQSGVFTPKNELTDDDPLEDTTGNILSMLKDFGVAYSHDKILKQAKN